jgi:hypothetical protein
MHKKNAPAQKVARSRTLEVQSKHYAATSSWPLRLLRKRAPDFSGIRTKAIGADDSVLMNTSAVFLFHPF